MNEEELKKGCGKEIFSYVIPEPICGELFHNKVVYCEVCQARLEGFQQGKLQAKKEELAILLSVLDSILLSVLDSIDILVQRMKQLQKEIKEVQG